MLSALPLHYVLPVAEHRFLVDASVRLVLTIRVLWLARLRLAFARAAVNNVACLEKHVVLRAPPTRLSGVLATENWCTLVTVTSVLALRVERLVGNS